MIEKIIICSISTRCQTYTFTREFAAQIGNGLTINKMYWTAQCRIAIYALASSTIIHAFVVPVGTTAQRNSQQRATNNIKRYVMAIGIRANNPLRYQRWQLSRLLVQSRGARR